MCRIAMQVSPYSSVDGMTTILVLTLGFKQLSFQKKSLDQRGGMTTYMVRLKGE